METIAGLSVVILVLTAFVVATKTFVLWLRTRELPELLLSIYLTGATVLGYPLLIAASQIPPTEMWPLHLCGSVVTNIGFSCLLLFTLKVFRPGVLWARLVVAACVLVFVSGSVYYFNELTGPSPRSAGEMLGLNVSSTIPIAIAYFWTTAEALGYHRRLKLRLRLGLTDIGVVNRVLLWGGMTFSAGLAVVISLVGMLSGAFMTMPLVLGLSCLGIVHAGCLFFAFHPPSWYRTWLEQRAPAEGI
jgi:hypothetical protein